MNWPKLKTIGLAVLLSSWGVSKGFSDDMADIHALLDRIQGAYPKNDTQAISECLSDSFIAAIELPNRPQSAVVLDKTKIMQGMAQVIADISQHEFLQRAISVHGPTALIQASVLDRRANGNTSITQEARIAIREGTAWRILLAFPLFVEPKTIVISALPGSQGEQLGLRQGDIVTHYANQPIQMAGQLTDLVKQHASDSPEGKIPLQVLRGTEEIALGTRPGALGIQIDTRLFPTDGARLIGIEDKHAIQDLARRINDALQKSDVDRMLQDHCPSGSIVLAYTSNGLTVFTASNAKAGMAQVLQAYSQIIKLETIQFHGAQGIVKDNLAVVAVRGSYETTQGQPKKYVNFQLYARQDGKWYFLADMPVANIDIGSGSPFIEPGTSRAHGSVSRKTTIFRHGNGNVSLFLTGLTPSYPRPAVDDGQSILRKFRLEMIRA